MGERVLDRADELRKSVTFRPDMTGLLPEGTRFYHPLPRDRKAPVIPTFLDRLPVNAWDAQSVNGYYTRIALLGMVSGLYGQDFQGEFKKPKVFDEDFVSEAPVADHKKPEYKVGIKPVENGIVIDHIASGQPIREIWDTVDKVRRILGLDVRSSHGVYHSNAGPESFKGILSLPDILSFDRRDLKKLGAIAPGCTLNLVKDSRRRPDLQLRPDILQERILRIQSRAPGGRPGRLLPLGIRHLRLPLLRSGAQVRGHLGCMTEGSPRTACGSRQRT